MTDTDKPQSPHSQSGPRQYQDDEIDLRKLFQSIGSFFSRIWKGIINIIVAIRRETLSHKPLFIVLAIFGIIAGFGSQQVFDPHYRTSMLLHSSIFRGQLIENTITKLDLLCEEEDRTELAEILGISLETADDIKGFEAIPFVSEEEVIQVEILREQLKGLDAEEQQINSVIDRIQIENKSTYEIVVRVYDTEIVPHIEESILNFLRQNPYISKRLEVTRQNRLFKKAKLQKEIQKLDSLKQVIYQNLSTLAERSREGSNNVILAEDNMSNPLSMIREDMNLYDQELEIDRQLALEPEFEVVDGFTTFTKPESAGLVKSTAIAILVSIGLGYLFLILKGINSYLARIEEEQMSEKTA